MRKAVRLLLLVVAGCPGDGSPCVSCPAIEGVWFVQYLAPDFPCDGGTPGAPANTLQLTREGSMVRSVIDGIAVSGTLYDTFDFTLNGQMPGGGETISLRATYKPPSKADAGDSQLVSGRLGRITGACDDERRFTGARF